MKVPEPGPHRFCTKLYAAVSGCMQADRSGAQWRGYSNPGRPYLRRTRPVAGPVAA